MFVKPPVCRDETIASHKTENQKPGQGNDSIRKAGAVGIRRPGNRDEIESGNKAVTTRSERPGFQSRNDGPSRDREAGWPNHTSRFFSFPDSSAASVRKISNVGIRPHWLDLRRPASNEPQLRANRREQGMSSPPGNSCTRSEIAPELFTPPKTATCSPASG